MRASKVRAAEQDRKIKDVMAELLAAGVSRSGVSDAPLVRRVQLPLVRWGSGADSEDEMTPQRVAEILSDQEGGWTVGHDDAAV